MNVQKIAVITVGLACILLSGCSQKLAKNSQTIDSTQWVKVSEKQVSEAEPEKPPIIKAETFLATGRLLESQGNFLQAAKIYHQACEARPDYVAAWNRYGICCDKLGQYDQAEYAFNKAIELAPEASFLHNNLGFSYLLAGKYSHAETSFRKALAINSQFQRARVNLGLALAKGGNFEEALTEFKQALPESQAYYNIAYFYRLDGKWQQASEAYKQALALDPSLSEAKAGLALSQENNAKPGSN